MRKIRPEEQPGFEFRPGGYGSPGMKRMQERLTLRAIGLLGVRKGRVLDIGCGTGYSTRVLAAQGFDVVGIDPNKKMIENAQGVNCAVGSFEKIPFPDKSFDAAVSISALQWADTKRAAKEVSRVLKYSARAVMQFYPSSDGEAMHTARAFAREGFEAKLAIDLPGNPKKRKVFLVLSRG